MRGGPLKALSGWRVKRFLQAAARRRTLARSCGIAAVVGTLLTLVNHPELFTQGAPSAADLARTAVTCVGPFCVATWSAAAQASVPKT